MKKKLIGLLASLACLACFAGCNNPLYSGDGSDSGNPTQSSSSVDGAQSYDVKGAAEYIADMYKAQDSSGRTDYTVAKKVLYDGAAYTIAWSVNVDCVKIVEQENDILVDVDEDSEVEVKYVLTATVTAPDGSTETVTVNRTLEAAPSVVPQPITSAPSEDETYKLYMYQVTKQADLYFTGKMSDYYLATTNHSNGEDYTKGVDIKVKKVEGKDSFYLTFIDPADPSGTKVQYIGVLNNYSNGKWRYNAIYSSSPVVEEGVTATYEFTYSAEYGTMIATLSGIKSGSDENTTETSTDSFYLGTYSSYWTIGASSVSRIKDEDACIAYLAVMQDKSSITPEKKVETEASMLSIQESYTGAVSAELPAKGSTYSDVSISWAVKSGDAKVEDGKLVVAAPSATTEIVLTATVKAGEVSETVDFTVTVYPVFSITDVTAPQEGVAYSMYLYQANKGINYYFTGTKDGNFFATSESASKAADVYVEAADGGYKFYVMNNGAKQYISLEEYDTTKGKASVNLESTTDSIFTYNAETKAWFCARAAFVYCIGTYGDFTTISASNSSYITAENSGVTQFPVSLAIIEGVEKDPADGGNEGEKPGDNEKPVAPSTPAEIVDAAWALAEGAALEGTYSLTGVITELGTYNAEYKDINVTFVIEGKEDKPMYCYALKGATDGQLAVGDTITVSGSIKNFKGTVEFDKPNLDSHVPANGETPDDGGEKPVVPSTPEEILNALYALSDSESLSGEFTLTGKITALDNYKNPTIVVEGFEDKPVYCYYLSVENAVGDIITVTATGMKNYQGIYEFINCTLVSSETPDDGGETPDDGGDEGETPVVVPEGMLAVFEFGKNGDAAHNDGNYQNPPTSLSYTCGDYTLNITGLSKVFDGAFDAMGNSCLKLGTGSVAATMAFEVAEDVTSVILRIAGYKAKTATLVINGETYTVTTQSNNGEYTEIIIDTTSTKTVSIQTTSDGYRAMIDSIAFA